MFDLLGMGVPLIILGGAFSCIGLLHNVPIISRLDVRLSCSLHFRLHKFLSLFRVLWLFGKSPALIVILIMLFILDSGIGGRVMFIYVVIAVGERILKLMVKRQRPFSLLPEVEMCQPRQPQDPSFPSGDAMRLWYLTFVLPPAFVLPWFFLLLFGGIALLASLGRIAFGVHFLLDVIGGAGLGLLGAGLYLICLSF